MQKQYAGNASYQRKLQPADSTVVSDMNEPTKFKQYLGDEKRYSDFLRFFQGEIEKKGWENVLNEYLFSFDERSDDMLVRLFSGMSTSPLCSRRRIHSGDHLNSWRHFSNFHRLPPPYNSPGFRNRVQPTRHYRRSPRAGGRS